MRARIALIVVVMAGLPACGGVMSYSHEDTVFVGRLSEDDPNILEQTVTLQAIGFADELQYAVDRSGAIVGICRTTLPEPGLAGEFVLEVYDIAGQRIAEENQTTFLRKTDAVARTNLQRSVQDDPGRFMQCRTMGASSVNDRLVVYLRPSGFDAGTHDVAVEFWVRHQSLSVTDVELFSRDGEPHRVVARDNPLKGHTVAIIDGHIEVDGAPLRSNGQAVAADSAKHRFQ